MKTKRSLYLAISAMLMAMLACGPSGVAPTPDLTATFGVALTAAFATAQGNLPPPSATGVSVAEATATTTVPAGITATTAPSVTAGPTACTDAAQFVADVTIPDGTQFAAPSAFTKTWRIQNIGTCTWSPTYILKFAEGAQMGGPAAVAFPGNVAPNATMDISVNLTSPAAPGNYTGKWRLTNPAGSSFLQITVVINVPAPTATFTNTALPTNTPVPPTATFTPVPPTNTPVPPTATNTTAPAVVFTAGYAGYWLCGTQPRVNFQVINTGSVTIESMNIRVEGPIGTYLNGNTQESPFRSSPSQPSPFCFDTGVEWLGPGSAAWVNTNVPSIPAGSSGRGVIKLCSQPGLGGSCLEVTVDFTY